MDGLDILRSNLLSPMTLSFALGVIATLLRSDLKFPEPVYAALSIYLLFAIGLKGGVALSTTPPGAVVGPALGGVCLGLAIPLWTFALLHRVGGFSRVDAAALAAHYGSVSAVTFIAALAHLEGQGRPAEGFMPAVLAIMEVPAILLALLLARSRAASGGAGESWQVALREIAASRSILLLAGGLVIGALAGPRGYKSVAPFFADPFQGALCLFLLDLGMVAAQRFTDLRRVGAFLLAFGIGAPIVNGLLGAWIGRLTGLSASGTAVLATLAASASYIAAPAAVRLALPAANPGYYLTASLAITFPFNLAIGLPLYDAIARFLHR